MIPRLLASGPVVFLGRHRAHDHQGDALSALAASSDAVILAAGWTSSTAASSGPNTSTCPRSGVTLALWVMDAAVIATVSLSER